MVVRVRLLRGGRKKRPHYSVVIANSHVSRNGKFIEKVGTYDPMLAKDHPDRIVINAERISYWFSQGAQPTDAVVKFLLRTGATLPEKIQTKWDIKVSAQKKASDKENTSAN